MNKIQFILLVPACDARIANISRYFCPIRPSAVLLVPPDALRLHASVYARQMCRRQCETQNERIGMKTNRTASVPSRDSTTGAVDDAVGALVSKYVSARRSDAVRLAYVIDESCSKNSMTVTINAFKISVAGEPSSEQLRRIFVHLVRLRSSHVNRIHGAFYSKNCFM